MTSAKKELGGHASSHQNGCIRIQKSDALCGQGNDNVFFTTRCSSFFWPPSDGLRRFLQNLESPFSLSPHLLRRRGKRRRINSRPFAVKPKTTTRLPPPIGGPFGSSLLPVPLSPYLSARECVFGKRERYGGKGGGGEGRRRRRVVSPSFPLSLPFVFRYLSSSSTAARHPPPTIQRKRRRKKKKGRGRSREDYFSFPPPFSGRKNIFPPSTRPKYLRER